MRLSTAAAMKYFKQFSTQMFACFCVQCVCMCVCKRERESVSMHMNAFRSTNGHLSKEDVVVHMFSLLTLLFSFFS